MPDEMPEIMDDRMRSAYKAALIRACIELRDLIREKISTPGSKGVYSPEGEAPYKQSGNLWKSYKWMVSSTATGLEDANVYSDPAIAPYQKFLEEGTGKMGARPHYWDALEEYDFGAHVQMYFIEEISNPTRVFGTIVDSAEE